MLQQYELGHYPPQRHLCTPAHIIHTSALPTVVILTTAPPLALKRCTGRSGRRQRRLYPVHEFSAQHLHPTFADVYLTYAEACLGNSEELTGGPGLKH